MFFKKLDDLNGLKRIEASFWRLLNALEPTKASAILHALGACKAGKALKVLETLTAPVAPSPLDYLKALKNLGGS